MATKYYSLLTREVIPSGHVWAIAFGDYDRETVEFEREDYRDNGHKAKDLKIITTDDSHAAIRAAVDKLNGKA